MLCMGVTTDPNKISSVTNWPTQTNVIELRGFYGLLPTCIIEDLFATLQKLL